MSASARVKDLFELPEIERAFDKALATIGGSLKNKRSQVAYLQGSFGSGKSHFIGAPLADPGGQRGGVAGPRAARAPREARVHRRCLLDELGDAAFFAPMNAGAPDDDAWGDYRKSDTWDRARFEAAAPSSDRPFARRSTPRW